MWTRSLSPVPAQPQGLCIGLRVLAFAEAGFALLQSLKLVAPDVPIANGSLAGLITTVHLIVAPILAVAALVFALRDRLPEAIMALAAIALTTWASELMSGQFTGIAAVLANVVRPVIAVLAIVLAVRRTRLGVAALLVASVWLAWAWVTFLSDILLFVMGTIIYGV